MHLDLCARLYPDGEWSERSNKARVRHLPARTLVQLMSPRHEHAHVDISTRMILLHLMRESASWCAAEWDGVFAKEQRRFAAGVWQVRSLARATDYWIMAYALGLHGVCVDTRPLLRLERALPECGCRTHGRHKAMLEGFNCAGHAVLCETQFLREVRRDLQPRQCVQWLGRFWRVAGVREDVEYVSELLNCFGATGMPLREDEVVESMLMLLERQGRSGCWLGSRTASRYDRFHATWRATEALHLGGRVLSGVNWGAC
jgi:hypothetical protein